MTDRNRSVDVLFSKLVRTRGACQRCRFVSATECAHIHPRRYLRTRWDPRNAWALCHQCHRQVDTNAVDFYDLVDDTIGRGVYDELYRLSHAVDTPKPDRVEIRRRLRRELNELEVAA